MLGSGSGAGTPVNKPNHLEIMGNGGSQRSTNGNFPLNNFFRLVHFRQGVGTCGFKFKIKTKLKSTLFIP